jgi:hypothetical protein
MIDKAKTGEALTCEAMRKTTHENPLLLTVQRARYHRR